MAQNGTHALPPGLLAWWVKRAALLAGLPPGIHAHQLRHTTATILLGQRVPLPDVSRRLGHARRSTSTPTSWRTTTRRRWPP